jgi:hypothetical protein
MKYFLILMLIPLLFCGCNKAKPEAEPTEEATEEISVDIDQALSDYEKGSWIEDTTKPCNMPKNFPAPSLRTSLAQTGADGASSSKAKSLINLLSRTMPKVNWFF